ncbi:MAG: NAD(P)/FAD-dependent oxidoreductase [Opitutales bacterium]|nr:NAD(P)/FAD-dependent oxidoreductase [Opitutales bacterium]
MQNDFRHKHHVVILGGGFGGLECCRALRHADVMITLIDRANHHLFQPLLYQVATAGLSAPEIAQPIRAILSRQKNVRVLLDEALSIDTEERRVALLESGPIHYDSLIVATGARTNYFGNDHWAAFAPGLKTLEDAQEIRHRVLLAFERAERERDAAAREALMRIVVVGGGPTGVELAGAFAELTKRVLARDFRNTDPARAQVVLLEVAPGILRGFPDALSAKASRQLEELGVDVRVGQKINDIRAGEIELADETLRAATIVWGAGVRAVPLAHDLPVEKDRTGRLKVAPDLSLPGYPEVFAIGDIAYVEDAAGKIVPGVSPAAMQMGRYVGQTIGARLKERKPPPPFRYFDKGSMATIGRSRAVAQVGPLRFSGFSAWLAWLFVHLVFLVGFRNKLAVMLQWFYSYVNFRRGARLITEPIEVDSDGSRAQRRKGRMAPTAPSLPPKTQPAEPVDVY